MICEELGLSSLLHVDLQALRSSGEHLNELTQGLSLYQRLQPAGLYLDAIETLFDKEGKPSQESRVIQKFLTEANGPVFIPCEPSTSWRELLTGSTLDMLPVRPSGLRNSPATLGKRYCDRPCRDCRIGFGGAGGSFCVDAETDCRRSRVGARFPVCRES